ncbi:hypothetical protein ACVW00_001285 [Marmoricola sp. URHA0025 HA25]
MPHNGARNRLGIMGLIAVVLALSMTMFGAAVTTASATHINHHRLHASADHVRVMSYVFGHTASGKKVRGVFIPRSFRMSGDRVIARGVLKGKIVRPGTDRHFTKRHVRIPVSSVDGTPITPEMARAAFRSTVDPTCNVLNLVLGPLDLNILGLRVHLNQVVLDITAQSGSGQLLGNLLCAVAHLLDPGSTLSGILGQLTTLLNRILGALGTLRA